MDVLLLHELRKFLLLLIPDFILNLNVLPATIITTIIPYTPINLLIFVLIFLVIYFTGIFNLSQKDAPYCRYNKLEQKKEFSTLVTLLNAYKIYFVVAFIINYNSISVYQIQGNNSFRAI